MAGVISTNYATALFNIASEENKLKLFKKELEEVNLCILENKEFLTIMNHPKVSKIDKKSIIQKIFQFNQYILNFIEIIIDKNRFYFFQDIYNEFVHLANEFLRIEVAEVTSAVPLNEDELTNIKALLKDKLQKNIEIVTVIDEDVIAGIRIKIKDYILDNTVAGELRGMGEVITKSNLSVGRSD